MSWLRLYQSGKCVLLKAVLLLCEYRHFSLDFAPHGVFAPPPPNIIRVKYFVRYFLKLAASVCAILNWETLFFILYVQEVLIIYSKLLYKLALELLDIQFTICWNMVGFDKICHWFYQCFYVFKHLGDIIFHQRFYRRLVLYIPCHLLTVFYQSLRT